MEKVRILIKCTRITSRKLYLLIIRPNSHEKLTWLNNHNYSLTLYAIIWLYLPLIVLIRPYICLSTLDTPCAPDIELNIIFREQDIISRKRYIISRKWYIISRKRDIISRKRDITSRKGDIISNKINSHLVLYGHRTHRDKFE